jgi:excinuclease UvrABC nuclease subunit
MYKHARNLEFEEAAKIRDTIEKMKQLEVGLIPGEGGADSGRGRRGAA